MYWISIWNTWKCQLLSNSRFNAFMIKYLTKKTMKNSNHSSEKMNIHHTPRTDSFSFGIWTLGHSEIFEHFILLWIENLLHLHLNVSVSIYTVSFHFFHQLHKLSFTVIWFHLGIAIYVIHKHNIDDLETWRWQGHHSTHWSTR